MKLFILCLFITLLSARPERPPQREGEFRNIQGRRRFRFDNTKLKASEYAQNNQIPKEPVLKYDVELQDNFHSLDDEEEIEKVLCGEKTLEIFATQQLKQWIKTMYNGVNDTCNCIDRQTYFEIEYYN